MGRPLTNLIGQKFGRWTVLSYQGNKHWLCRCECGTNGVKQTGALRLGSSKSCGCLQRELIALRNYKHGMVGHPAYDSWSGAKIRCSDPKRRYYAGKNIKMHPDWLDFNVFWAEMGPSWAPGLSIDRIDNDGDYVPGNCRWATPKQQSNNRSCCVVIPTPQGPMNITQAAEAFGINRWTIAHRIRMGWKDEDLLLPVNIANRSRYDFGI